MRDRGEELIAIYHSHPRAKNPEPSETDVRLAYYPSAVYFIVGLGGEEPCLHAFRISEREVRWEAAEFEVLTDKSAAPQSGACARTATKLNAKSVRNTSYGAEAQQ